MKSVFAYIDFRVFLRDYYEWNKENTSYFSYRWFNQKAGIKSPAFLKLVIEGKRNLGDDGIEKFIKALGFQAKEALYFRKMVLFNQARTSEEKQEHYRTLRDLTGAVEESPLHKDAYQYYSAWYLPVLRELITLYPFGEDYKAVADSLFPPIGVKEAEDGVKLLSRMKLIRRSASGWVQNEAAITSGPESDRVALLEFHRNMLRLSAEALDFLSKDQRHVSALTVGVSQSSYDAVIAEYHAFRERVLKLVHGDKESDRVLHLAFQAVPVAAVPGSELRSASEWERYTRHKLSRELPMKAQSTKHSKISHQSTDSGEAS